MNQSFTNNNLIKLLYKEISALDKIEMEYALNENFQLREEMHILEKSKKIIPKVKFRPSTSTINRIIEYSLKAKHTAHA